MTTSDDIFLTVAILSKKFKSKGLPLLFEKLVERQPHIKVTLLTDGQILEDDVETWPKCDAFMFFYAPGFPMKKACRYIEKYQPYLVNKVNFTKVPRNRDTLFKDIESIPEVFIPKSITCNRTKNPLVTVTENGNQLVISNKIEGSNEIINRPFVEKGLGVEEHDVRIYHKDQLKSCVRMQRVKGLVSVDKFEDCGGARGLKSGDWVYQQFLENALEIKVYTAGFDYVHAETRNSSENSILEGKEIARSPDGKEIRDMALLSGKEKLMVRKIQERLEQPFMGIDILRCESGSFVIDINSVKFDETFKTNMIRKRGSALGNSEVEHSEVENSEVEDSEVENSKTNKSENGEFEVHVNEIGVPKAERTRFINDVAVMLADEIHSKLENPCKELNFKSLTYFVKPGQISEPSQVGLSILRHCQKLIKSDHESLDTSPYLTVTVTTPETTENEFHSAAAEVVRAFLNNKDSSLDSIRRNYFDKDYHDSLEFPVVKLTFLKTDEVLKGGATSETDFCYFFE